VKKDEGQYDRVKDLPEVALARHAVGNRKTAVQMVEQLIPRVSDPKTRAMLEERLRRFRIELNESEEQYERIVLESLKKID
jgi:hypothetical protein